MLVKLWFVVSIFVTFSFHCLQVWNDMMKLVFEATKSINFPFLIFCHPSNVDGSRVGKTGLSNLEHFWLSNYCFFCYGGSLFSSCFVFLQNSRFNFEKLENVWYGWLFLAETFLIIVNCFFLFVIILKTLAEQNSSMLKAWINFLFMCRDFFG